MSRVVIIDGDVERRAGISMALRGIGCDVREVNDATAALGVALKNPVDWLLCSWPMVGWEARTLARAMRSETRLKAVPLFAYSRSLTESMERDILAAGFDGAASGFDQFRAFKSWKIPSREKIPAESPSARPGSALFDIVSDTVSIGMAHVSSEGVILWENQAWRRFLTRRVLSWVREGPGGCRLEMCECARIGECGLAHEIASEIRRTLNREQPRFCKTYPVPRDGDVDWFMVEAVSTGGGTEIAAVVTIVELPERREETRSTGKPDAWLSAMLDLVTDPVFVFDDEGKILEVSPHACTALGFTREELLGLSIRELELDSDAAAAAVGPGDSRQIERVGGSESRGTLRRKDGTRIPVESRVGEVEWRGRRHFLMVAKDITQRLGVEAILEERDRKLNMAVEAGNVGLWDWDLVTNRVWFSPEWKRQIGYLDHEIEGTYEEWQRRLHPDDLEQTLATLRDCLAGTSGKYENEFRFFHKNGSYRWILARGALIKSTDGRPIRILGAHLDISEHKYVEEALRHSEERYRRLFDANPQPMWLFDMETLRFIAVNEAAVAHYGYSREEFLGMRVLDIRPPEEVPRLLEKLRRSTMGFDQAGVWKHRRKDGTLIDVEVSVHSVMLGGRRTELVLANDVTARRQAEQRVQQLNRIYAVLSDINKLIVRERDSQVILDGACRIAVERGGFLMAWIGRPDPLTHQLRPVASAGIVGGYLDLLDINLKDPRRCTGPAGKSLLSGRHEVANDLETDPDFAPWRDLALSRGFRSSASFVLRPSPGRTPVGILCLYSSTREFFDEEELRLLDELAADISFALEGCEREEDRKRADRAMRDSEERFRQLTETIDDVFWMMDPRTKEIIYVSPAYERIWGRSCSELWESPMAWMDAVHPEDKPKILSIQFGGKAGDLRSEEYRILRPDGRVRWIRDRVFPVVGPDNEVTRVVGVARDVTDLRQLEEQLRQSQKLEAIGQLAGGVAHDFNNILAAILMQVELAGLSQGLSPDLVEGLGEIRLSAERAVALTRQLLLFGRKQVMQRRRVDLNIIVENLARMLQRVIGEDIRLQLNLDSQPVFASADAGMIDQVLVNLAVNSRDSMPKGGRLSIETRRFNVTQEHLRRHPDATVGLSARLSVVDTGCGIHSEVLPHIFEPFFTTKDPGKGTGLGLATVFGIVKQHQGWIEVESTQGCGARFDVYLPLDQGGIGAEQVTPMPKIPARGNGETILLVEDDASVKLSTKALLERQGYRVLEAASGIEALEVWSKHRYAIGLLVTDLVMPGGMSGLELARRIQQQGPGLKAIFTSGYSADIAGRELQLNPGEFFLQKPFPPNLLLERVRTCLGESRSANTINGR